MPVREKRAGRVYRLSYASTITPAAAAVLSSTVEDILVASVANNRRDRITGFLLCDGLHFAQALEGPELLVEDCFARIAADPRNTAVTLREAGPTNRRAFDRWSMCGLTLSAADDALLQPSVTPFNLTAVSAGALWQLLTGLAERHGAALDAEHERLLRI